MFEDRQQTSVGQGQRAREEGYRRRFPQPRAGAGDAHSRAVWWEKHRTPAPEEGGHARTLWEPGREGPAVGADDETEEDFCFNHSF